MESIKKKSNSYKQKKLIKKGTDYSENYFTSVYDQREPAERIAVFEKNLEIINKYVTSGKLLDIGCAYGEFLYVAKEKFAVSGVDISSFAVAKAKKFVFSSEIHVVNVETQKLPFPKNSFDIVTCFDIVEHLKSTDLLFNEIYRVLNKHGILLLTTESHKTIFANLFGKIITDDPTHINKKHYKEWLDLLARNKFQLINIKGSLFYGFPPSTKLRRVIEKLGLPVLRRIIFSPWLPLSVNMYFLLQKN